MKYHHIGICCKNIKFESIIYQKFGAKKFSKIYKDKNLRVKVCFFNFGNLKYELVQPFGKKSPINNLLKKKLRIYHVAFQVKNLNNKINSFIKSGAIMIHNPARAIAFNGKKVCFMMMPNQDIVEFIEK